jgi:spore cortex formation protein SpoVR/YcgB (stage V sporulation)
MNKLTTPLIKSGQDWTSELIEDVYLIIERIATEKYELEIYPNQIEIISSEQMLDAYASYGLPIIYPHWSFGKTFVQQQELYKRGYTGLAYEVVINSSPCISYNMEENTMVMMALVMAHAAIGHNAFFKNNYAFKQWTDAEGIIDYLVFAKKYIISQEEKHGYTAVEEVLDACHALLNYGISRYKKPRKLSAEQEKARAIDRETYIQQQLNLLWSTIPRTRAELDTDTEKLEEEENILYFIEKKAPRLEQWEREIIRIVRKLSQYTYPNMLTRNMNEGFACWTHYNIIHDLYNMGVFDNGAMLEFYKFHTSVCFQPDFDDPRYSGLNPYSLFFEIFKDIERICISPTIEDRKWFHWAGNNEPYETIKFAMENFKDDSFILQYLSPKIARDFHLFNILDDERDPMIEITAIHNDEGFKHLRDKLSKQNSYSYHIPDIQVHSVDWWGQRSLKLRHIMIDNRPLEPKDATQVVKQIHRLWKYPVHLHSVNEQNHQSLASFITDGKETLLDVFLEEDPN